MSKLDERIEVIREQYGLAREDFWELPQRKGTWVAKHSALEIVAVKAGIVFDAPQIIDANTEKGIAVLAVRGSLPAPADKREGRSEWATGEAAPNNNKNAYPWAMAEKRAKDRVVLKLAGIHGLVYSEDELDEPRKPTAAIEGRTAPNTTASMTMADDLQMPARGPLKSSAQAKRDGDWEELKAEIDACATLSQLNILVASKPFLDAVAPIPNQWKAALRDYIQTYRDELTVNPPKADDPFGFDKLAAQGAGKE